MTETTNIDTKDFVDALIKKDSPKAPKLTKDGHILATKDDPDLYEWAVRG